MRGRVLRGRVLRGRVKRGRVLSPQVQERLTNQIAEELKRVLETDDVAVIIDAKHLCVASRGVKDDTSTTITSYYGGAFNTPEKILELQNFLNN